MKKIILTLVAMIASTLMVNAQTYKIGDLYDVNGVKGIVFRVDDSGQHGLIMSLDDCGDSWCVTKLNKKDTKHESIPTDTEAFDENDGAKNMEVIEKYVNETGISWDYFPLLKWAKELGDGWYIPSKNELWDIIKYVNIGETETMEIDTLRALDKRIKAIRGKVKKDKSIGFVKNISKSPINSFYVFNIMLSSTEVEGGSACGVYFKESTGSQLKNGFIIKSKRKGTFEMIPINKITPSSNRKISPVASRAVHKF
ncbi:MAG: hypothetical protein J5905_08200 [Prevotella sp.]|nr:hypothetical protein [Prevotella sp.]